MTIGEIIQRLRKKAGLNQGQLAEACDISQTYLSQIERGRREPHLITLKSIATALNIPVALLFFLTLDVEDVPEEKRKAFEMIFPSLQAFIEELFVVGSERV